MKRGGARSNKNDQWAVAVFTRRIRSAYGPRVVMMKMYGSAARGERREESDVDILVVIDGLTWEEKRSVWDEATNVNIRCDALLSPLVMTPDELKELRRRERRIALDIEKEGIAL